MKNLEKIFDNEILIQSTTIEDKNLFYDLCANSDATPFWYGDFYENKIPSKKVFFDVWKDYYFDGSKPFLGRAYLVNLISDSSPVIGNINYHNVNNSKVEIDMLISDKNYWNKGIGSKMTKLFANYLFNKFEIDEIWGSVINKNPRSLCVMEKIGFKKMIPDNDIINTPQWEDVDLSKWTFVSLKREN